MVPPLAADLQLLFLVQSDKHSSVVAIPRKVPNAKWKCKGNIAIDKSFSTQTVYNFFKIFNQKSLFPAIWVLTELLHEIENSRDINHKNS